MPIIYCYHFLTLQLPRFASGFKTRWWWVITLPLAQHVTWKTPHTLHFLHRTHLGTYSSMKRVREEAHSGVQHPQPGQDCTAPRHHVKHHSQASSCWTTQWQPGKGEEMLDVISHPKWSCGVTGTRVWVWEAALIPLLWGTPSTIHVLLLLPPR